MESRCHGRGLDTEGEGDSEGDPADVERECENLSDDEEGVEVETENSVVVID